MTSFIKHNYNWGIFNPTNHQKIALTIKNKYTKIKLTH